MPSTLVQFLGENLRDNDRSTHWEKFIRQILENSSSEDVDASALVQEIAGRPLASFGEYLSTWRETLALYLMGRYFPAIDASVLVEKLKKHKYFGRFQLGRLFDAITAEKPFSFKQLPQGGILLETDNQLEELSIPKPQLTAELSVLGLIHGLITKDRELLSAVLRFARFHMQTLDRKGKPFAGLWSGVKHFSYATSYGLNYLLFSSTAHLSPWPKFHLLAETQLTLLKEMDSERFEEIAPYLAVLSLVLERELDNEIEGVVDEDFKSDDEKDLGFSTFQGSSLHIACTTSGAHSGVGAISKGNVRIVSMGPCFQPLGEPHTYGVHRMPPLSDTIVRKDNEEFSFNGWTRLIHPEEGHLSKSWMELQVQGSKNRGRVTVRFSENTKDLHFAFFIESTEAIVNEHFYLQPASLDRYAGESAEIQFQMGDHALKILPKGDSGMQVIPLAGGDHFWGANFLVAFAMPPESTPVHWEII